MYQPLLQLQEKAVIGRQVPGRKRKVSHTVGGQRVPNASTPHKKRVRPYKFQKAPAGKELSVRCVYIADDAVGTDGPDGGDGPDCADDAAPPAIPTRKFGTRQRDHGMQPVPSLCTTPLNQKSGTDPTQAHPKLARGGGGSFKHKRAVVWSTVLFLSLSLSSAFSFSLSFSFFLVFFVFLSVSLSLSLSLSVSLFSLSLSLFLSFSLSLYLSFPCLIFLAFFFLCTLLFVCLFCFLFFFVVILFSSEAADWQPRN